MKAFPLSFQWDENHKKNNGMDLRDYFAAKAMQAMLASPELMVVVTASEVMGDTYSERCANTSYKYADAMMKAREK
jgi:hypothetical protein